MTTIDDGPHRSFSEDVRKKNGRFPVSLGILVIRYQSTISVQSPLISFGESEEVLVAKCLLLRTPQEKLGNKMARGKENVPTPWTQMRTGHQNTKAAAW